ncbi:hypothetical protein [Paracoccus binzhouensis]|uniref:hypothetical protein n=1 Tax=Paracoccus binzhouensis TaxID=2796149 RepID=UPI0018EF0418|nr:hypothetical protein [Paracoccus binzhouensis]
MLGNVAAALGWQRAALGFAIASAAVLGLAVLRGHWLTAAGFSPLWGAFTFPLAATAGLWGAASRRADRCRRGPAGRGQPCGAACRSCCGSGGPGPRAG